MGKQTIHNILRESFPKTGKDDWERVASQELGDNKQIKNLIWQIDDLIFYPYYDEKNVCLEITYYLKQNFFYSLAFLSYLLIYKLHQNME